MALVPNIIVGFMALWCLLYLVVYLHFLSSDASESATSTGKGPLMTRADQAGFAGDIKRNREPVLPIWTTNSQLIDPFLSTSCKTYIQEDKAALVGAQVAVIMVIGQETKEVVVRSATSIASQSSGILTALVLVDNSPSGEADTWAEWHSPVFSPFRVIHMRPPRRLGYAAAREFGVEHLSLQGVSYLAFVDAEVMVSPDWLYPLISTLHAHPNAIVYPAVDVIVEEGKETGFVKGDRVVASFDWEFSKKWIPFHSSSPESAEDDDDDIDEAISPAIHSSFAVGLSFYKQFGGYDPSLIGHVADMELSLRVWLCAGSIIRQPCSRIAQTFHQIDGDTFGEGSVGQYDESIIGVSHRWMNDQYRDLVFQARYLNRIPSKVTLSLDNLHPEKFTQAKLINEYDCLSMDWYVKEVNPSLIPAAEKIGPRFLSHISSSYLTTDLSPLLEQYTKKSLITHSPSILEKMAGLQKKYHDVNSEDKEMVSVQRNYRDEQHLAHQQWVKRTLTCEDENFFGMLGCEKFKSNGGCETDVAYGMFGCPKTCGHCDSNGQFCADYYIKRCSDSHKNNPNLCESDAWVRENCRLTCGFCTKGDSRKVTITTSQVSEATFPLKNGMERFDPFLAHQRYLAGELPDRPDANACSLNKRPNGDLLSRVLIETIPSTSPKIFCGVYTMEKNHQTNVKATMETWAKRCDGFVAFSTATDRSLSALRIEHEGEEKYDNMWQKSRR